MLESKMFRKSKKKRKKYNRIFLFDTNLIWFPDTVQKQAKQVMQNLGFND